MFKALFGGLGLKAFAWIGGVFVAAISGLLAYDRYVDDPQVAALARAQREAEINAETARHIAELMRKNADLERQQQARVNELEAANEKLEGEVDDLVRKFEDIDGADDDSGIDGQFVR
ncbi:MAG: hypothetical protein AAFO61_09365 [Pseudomonadota bacterium]